MKKLVMIITMAMVMTVLLPVVALAYDPITATGNWEVEYEVNDYTVGSSGGTGILRLKVKNTEPSSSTDIIRYVSISYATGTASEFYENRRVTIAPTRDQIIDFSIPISEENAGLGLQLWVAMSTGGEDDVDGIGVKNGIMFGPPATYDATLDITTASTTINQGESIVINFGGANSGNKSVDIKVYDQTGAQIFETNNMDILYFGRKSYTPSSTTTYRYRTEIYRLGTDRLEKEITSNSITVTVIEPTPEPTATPTPEPAEVSTPEPTIEPTPVPTIEPSPELSAEELPELVEEELSAEALAAEPESSDESLIVGAENGSINNSSGSNNTLWIIAIAFLVLVAVLLVVLIVFLLKGKKSDNFS